MKKENVFLRLENLSNEQLNELKQITGMQLMKNDCLFVFNNEYQQWYFTDDSENRTEVDFNQIKNLINWVSTEKTHPIKDSNVHFIIKGFEEKGNCGNFDGDLYWNKGEAYTKEIVSHFQYVDPKSFPL